MLNHQFFHESRWDVVQRRCHPVWTATVNEHAVDTNIHAGAEHAAILYLPCKWSVVISRTAGNLVHQFGGIDVGAGATCSEFGLKKLLTAYNHNFLDLILGIDCCACGNEE